MKNALSDPQILFAAAWAAGLVTVAKFVMLRAAIELWNGGRYCGLAKWAIAGSCFLPPIGMMPVILFPERFAQAEYSLQAQFWYGYLMGWMVGLAFVGAVPVTAALSSAGQASVPSMISALALCSFPQSVNKASAICPFTVNNLSSWAPSAPTSSL